MSAYEKMKCFGESWSGVDVHCKGGLDPVYQNPRALAEMKTTGRTNIPIHQREQCIHYAQCSHQTNFNRMQGFIPAENLTKGRAPQPTPPRSQPVGPRRMGESIHQDNRTPPRWQPPAPAPTWQQPPQQNQHMAPPWVAGYGPQFVPMPFQQPGAQMPGYLSVPEPIDPKVPFWFRMVLSLFRAGVKAIFHTGAHIIDHEPFIKHQQPPPPE